MWQVFFKSPTLFSGFLWDGCDCLSGFQPLLLPLRRAPVDVKELRQGAFDGGANRMQKDEC
jgi:hypothetical protein